MSKLTPEQRDLALRVAGAVEDLEYAHHETEVKGEAFFNMRRTQYDCGAPACLAGWTCQLAGVLEDQWHSLMTKAKGFLGLTRKQHDKLFTPVLACKWGVSCMSGPTEEGYISPQLAARVMRRYAVTGKVQWKKARADLEAPE